MRNQISHRITALILLLTILVGNSWNLYALVTGLEDSVSPISGSEFEFESPADHGVGGSLSFFYIVEESEIELEEMESIAFLPIAVITETSPVVKFGSLNPESECHEPMEREKYLLFHALTLYS